MRTRILAAGVLIVFAGTSSWAHGTHSYQVHVTNDAWLATNGGYVGIGKTNPSTQLDVAATIRSGSGVFSPTPNYDAGQAPFFESYRGSVAAPSAEPSAVSIVGKVSSYAGSLLNTSSYAYIRRRNSAAQAAITAAFAEARDEAGVQGFVEGMRAQGTLQGGTNNGSAYGLVATAGTDDALDTSYGYLIGAEGEVVNQTGSDAGPTLNPLHFSASFVASSTGSNMADAGFVTNPNLDSEARFRVGYLIGNGSVSDVAIRSTADTQVGIDLGSGSQSYAGIILPNETAIRINRGPLTPPGEPLNVMYLSTGNDLILGAQANNVVVQANRVGIGIGAEVPAYKLQVAGTAAATGWVTLSSATTKQNIERVPEDRNREMLQALRKVPLTTYEYREEYGGDGHRRLGFLAEDLPAEVLSPDEKAVDLYELLTYAIGALKAQQDQIEQQQATIDGLLGNQRHSEVPKRAATHP